MSEYMECKPSNCFMCAEKEKLCYKTYQQGYADGSLSVTEQIINEKVVKYLESLIEKDKFDFSICQRKQVFRELIKHFKGE